MTALHLPSSTIDKIIDDPTVLGSRSSNTTSTTLQTLGVSSATAARILDGYTNGFRIVFIMNATLAAIATVVSIVMIHHKELTRGDEEQLRAEARRQEKHTAEPKYHDDPETQGDVELPELQTHCPETSEIHAKVSAR